MKVVYVTGAQRSSSCSPAHIFAAVGAGQMKCEMVVDDEETKRVKRQKNASHLSIHLYTIAHRTHGGATVIGLLIARLIECDAKCGWTTYIFRQPFALTAHKAV